MGIPNASAVTGGIPGLIVPGQQQAIKGQKIVTGNSLRAEGLTQPKLLESCAYHLMTDDKSGIGSVMMPLMAHLNKRYRFQKGQSSIFGANDGIKMINDYEFYYNIPPINDMRHQVLEAPSFVNDVAGAGGQPFTFVKNDLSTSVDDVIMFTSDVAANMQLKVLAVTPAGRGLRVKVRTVGITAGIPRRYLEVGKQFSIEWNQKAERSQHGSGADITLARRVKNGMTTMRFERSYTGNAVNSAPSANAVEWFKYLKSDGSNADAADPTGLFWITKADVEMQRQANRAMDWYAMFGKADTNSRGEYMQDHRGYDINSGNGILESCNKRQFFQYNQVNVQFMDAIQRRFYFDGVVGEKEIVVLPGIELRVQIEKWITAQYTYSPQVLYVEKGTGKFYGSTAALEMQKPENMRGISTRFNYYETSYGKIYVAQGTFFDGNNLAQELLPDGTRLNSHTGIFLNITAINDGNGGEMCPIELLRVRPTVVKTVNGMAGTGDILSTTDDMVGKHLLTSMGIATKNPSMLILAYKAPTA